MTFIKKWIFVLSPAILATFFILSFYAEKAINHPLNQLIFPIIFFASVSILVWFISWLILKDIYKAIILASVFVIVLFVYRGIYDLLGNYYLNLGIVAIGKNRLVISSSLILVLASGLFLRRRSGNYLLAVKIILTFSVICLLLPTIKIIDYQTNNDRFVKIESPLKIQPPPPELNKNTLPDIYYIIPDSYSSSKVLKKYFNYDNTEFIHFLSKKGFYVTTDSASNYPKTFLSLTSTLNLEYLDYLKNYVNVSDQSIIRPLLENNQVVRYLKARGYRYYHLGSWLELTSSNRYADSNISYTVKRLLIWNEFSYALLKETPLSYFLDKYLPNTMVGEPEDETRNRLYFQFQELKEIINKPNPKFVFVHLISPHNPFLFDQNCQELNFHQTEALPEGVNYANQVNCLNHKLMNAIETIIAQSTKPPVILLQSDEGAQFLRNKVSPPDNWVTASDDLLKEKFPIFSAFLLPGIKPAELYSSISPVNAFRVIFNHYFSTNLPILEDRHYIFTNTENYFDFREVTY